MMVQMKGTGWLKVAWVLLRTLGAGKVVTVGQNYPRYSTVRVTTRWNEFLQMVLSIVSKDVMKEDEQ